MSKRNTVKYPCGECGQSCHLTNCLFCGICKAWQHMECQNMPKEEFEKWSSVSEDYICLRCVCRDGNFDFEAGLARMEQVHISHEKDKSKQKMKRKLHAVLQRETLLLRDRHITVGSREIGNFVEDLVSKQILEQCTLEKNVKPVKTSADGNCLFNAVSLLISGNEMLASELRYKTTIEMFLNEKEIMKHTDVKNFINISPPYEESLGDCSSDGEYSSIWTMIALCNVLNCSIKSVYPAKNGYDLAFKTLNLTLTPSKHKPGAPCFKIMWTSTQSQSGNIWFPNHFVPLVSANNVHSPSVPAWCTVRHSTPVQNYKVKPMVKKTVPIDSKKPKVIQIDSHDSAFPANSVSPKLPSPPQLKSTESEWCKVKHSKVKKGANKTVATASTEPKVIKIDDSKVKKGVNTTVATAFREPKVIKIDALNNAFRAAPTSPKVSSVSKLKLPARGKTVHCGTKDTKVMEIIELNADKRSTDVHSVTSEEAMSSDLSSLPSLSNACKKPKMSDSHSHLVNQTPSEISENISNLNDYISVSDDISASSHSSSSSSDKKASNDRNSFSNLQKLPHPGSFLTLDEVFQTIIKCNNTYALEHIPNGEKSNVFVVMDNKRNVEKKKANSKFEFSDDCGVWDHTTATTVNVHLLLTNTGTLRQIRKIGDVYYIPNNSKGNDNKTPLSPQPNDGDLFLMHRYYTKLKGNAQYRKRVTVFLKTPPKYSSKNGLALVEYCGVQTQSLPHGKSTNDEPYFRTRPDILEKAGTEAKIKAPKAIYTEMVEEDALEAPKNLKQIRQKKYREQKKDDKSTNKNVADEILNILALLDSNDHVQKIIHIKGKPPAVILYSENQLLDMKENLKRFDNCVLGVDRTFNLGVCFVTSIVYKNQHVLNRESGEPPIFLGPMYLHWDGQYETYHDFFAHVKTKIDVDISNFQIKIGSDDEKAMTKAIKSCFPTAITLLCTKHLKDNVARYLKDKVGCHSHDRKNIVEKCFGQAGVAKATDGFSFEDRVNLLDDAFEKYPRFATYFNKRLRELLWNNVCIPNQNGNTETLWTNNNCESINHVFKQAVDWKPQKLPQLLSKLISLTRLQMIDLRRALYGSGNYILCPAVKHYKIKRNIWISKTEKEKDEYFVKFLTKQKCKPKDQIVSSTANFAIPVISRIAKKPGQRKRPRSEKTKN